MLYFFFRTKKKLLSRRYKRFSLKHMLRFTLKIYNPGEYAMLYVYHVYPTHPKHTYLVNPHKIKRQNYTLSTPYYLCATSLSQYDAFSSIRHFLFVGLPKCFGHDYCMITIETWSNITTKNPYRVCLFVLQLFLVFHRLLYRETEEQHIVRSYIRHFIPTDHDEKLNKNANFLDDDDDDDGEMLILLLAQLK